VLAAVGVKPEEFSDTLASCDFFDGTAAGCAEQSRYGVGRGLGVIKNRRPVGFRRIILRAASTLP